MDELIGYVGPSNTRESARAYRYLLQLLDPMDGVLFFLSRASRPAPEIDVIVAHNGPTQVPRPGKYRWKPVEFTFYEVLTITPPYSDLTAELIYRWWAQNLYDIQTSTLGRAASVAPGSPGSYSAGVGTVGGYAAPSTVSNSGIYKQARLTMLDGVGERVWDYYLIDCWPSNVTPSELSYRETGIAEITVTLQYSACVEIIAGSGSSASLPQPGSPAYYNQDSTQRGGRFPEDSRGRSA